MKGSSLGGLSWTACLGANLPALAASEEVASDDIVNGERVGLAGMGRNTKVLKTRKLVGWLERVLATIKPSYAKIIQ